MASILLVGGNEALLEGLAQMLAHAGHVPHAAHSALDAIEVSASVRPLVAVIERDLALANPELARLPLESGGSFLIYHSGTAHSPRSRHRCRDWCWRTSICRWSAIGCWR